MDDDENISTLLAMGFPDIDEIRRALKLAKNDLSEAVAVLTNEGSSSSSVGLAGGGGEVFGPANRPDGSPPGSEGAAGATSGAGDVDMKDAATAQQDSSSPNGFPVANFFELEGRVFQDNWSIPYKTDESFGKCLEAATRLSKTGNFEKDEHCVKFIDRVLPEAFKKLLTSNATLRWHSEIQEGIYDMLDLFVDLVVARMRDGDAVPAGLLNILAVAFDVKTDWNHKNKDRYPRGRWENRSSSSSSSSSKDFAHPPKDYFSRAQFGWLCDLINSFGDRGGFDLIYSWFEKVPDQPRTDDQKDVDKEEECSLPSLPPTALAALLAPLANCVDMLEKELVQRPLADCVEKTFSVVKSLDVAELQSKQMSAVSDLLTSAKLLCLQFWPQQVAKCDGLRLDIILRMLKTPQFHSKMTALKEVSRLIEESKQRNKRHLTSEEVQQWMVENRILSVALEGNIDQVQYTDRIQAIVEFLGPQLKEEELTKMWRLAEGAGNVHVADNVYGMMAASGSKLTLPQFEHLTCLVKETWERLGQSDSRGKERLLVLVGKVGKEANNNKSTQVILELLWDLSHRPKLEKDLVEKALAEQLAILNDLTFNKDAMKRVYVLKCVDDLKRTSDSVGFAVKHLRDICKSYLKGSSVYNKADKATLGELNKQHEIVRLLTTTLRKCLSNMASFSPSGKVESTTLYDDRYTKGELVEYHLDLLKFLLKEGDLYLSWVRCEELWETLVANPQSLESDRDRAYKWFQDCLTDLEVCTQTRFFEEKLLHVRPEEVTESGFKCFKAFFEEINVTSGSLRKGSSPPFMVDRQDLSGLGFVWKLVTDASSEDIANLAIEYLLNMSFLYVSPKLKEESDRLHREFIQQCYGCLESVLQASSAECSIQEEEGKSASALEQGHELETSIHRETTPSQALMAISISNVSALPVNVRGQRLQRATRVLHLAERYISSIEEASSSNRSILPHAATFHGRKRDVKVLTENKKDEFLLQTHSNELIANVKIRISEVLKSRVDSLTFCCGETEVTSSKDRCLLGSMGEERESTWLVKPSKGVTTSSSTALVLFQEDFGGISSSSATAVSADSPTSDDDSRRAHEEEAEKSLPGVIMASSGKVFPMLYQLASLNDPKIVKSVRKIVHLIPTDPTVQEVLDNVTLDATSKVAEVSTTEASPKLSPRRKKAAPGGVAGETLEREQQNQQQQQQQQKQPDSGRQITLWDMFDAKAEKMNPFRVLYNLEVLSSRLVPTHAGAVPASAAQDFCTRFLDAGGLGVVLSVMDRNSLPPDVDYDIRQSSYLLALQLAYHLLCGKASAESVGRKQSAAASASSTLSSSLTASPVVKPTPPKRSALDSSISVASSSSCPPSAAKSPVVVSATKIVQTMTEKDFADTVSCLMRVAWAAAAGNLQLAVTSGGASPHSSSSGVSPGKPKKISDRPRFFLGSRRSRDSSTGSSGSEGSSLDSQSLHAGVCSQQSLVSPVDCQIASEAFELIVTCLQMRTAYLSTFYGLPLLSDFIIDTVLGSPSEGVRATARDQLIRLSKIRHAARALNLEEGIQETSLSARQMLTKILLKTPVPLWAPTCTARGISHSLLSQCGEYFDLRCALLRGMTQRDQKALGENAQSMVEDELTFLQNFTLCNRHRDCSLLSGHLRLLEALLTCEGVDKRQVGAALIPEILASFLFPASKLMRDGVLDRSSSALNFELFKDLNPKCDTPQSRVSAYNVLVELSRNSVSNMAAVASELVRMHHTFGEDLVRQFEYSPAVERRSESNFVGLKNAGATCYMNSVLQQLFCMPVVASQVLSINVESEEEESVFYQLQNVFGHLQESRLKFYEPEKFWHCFRLYGQPVNVREQQDAFEFFIQVVDQVDEYLAKHRKPKLFSSKFEGVFSDQKICQGCPHRYEREETFMALNLTVKSNNLQESLDQFVKGELLDGDNAYYCEKCKTKRNTIKRMCIRTLPTTLAIQLKRFHYDWETNRALKFDDFFRFPWTLDMSPYTTEGIKAKENQRSSQSNRKLSFGKAEQTFLRGECLYELVGVVVHSGQASAGHYYSYIKERTGGRWFKFNDTTVEAFDMNDESLSTECFGGKYKVKKEGKVNSNLPEERQRYWNAYILFYEAVKARVPVTPNPKKSLSQSQSRLRGGSSTGGGGGGSGGPGGDAARPSPRTSEPTARARESLSQLSDLLEKGERRGLFSSRMPASIERGIQEENLRFLENRDVFCHEYYRFVQDLLSVNVHGAKSPDHESICEEAVRLAASFLCNTYFHVLERQSSILSEMVDGVSVLVERSRRATETLLAFLASSEGLQYLRPFLLECPSRDVRVNFSQMVFSGMRAYERHHGDTESDHVNRVLSSLVGLLEKDVSAHCKNSGQFFWLVSKFAQMSSRQSHQLFQLNVFSQVIRFLLGVETDPGDDFDPKKHRRRWSSVQAKEFGELHSLLCHLVLSCQMAPRRNGTESNKASREESLLPMPATVSRLLYGPVAPVFVREAVCACREVSGSVDLIVEMLVKASMDSEKLSRIVVEEVMQQYNTINSGELKNLSTLLFELLVLSDSLQAERIRFAVEGDSSVKIGGLLQLVKDNQSSDSLRSYQCIKILVNASNKSSSVKEYLLLDPDRWQWSVNWLKNRMSGEDSSWAAHAAAGGSGGGGEGSGATAGATSSTVATGRTYGGGSYWGSNEDSSTRTFQRTTSAQVTLDEARAILEEFGGDGGANGGGGGGEDEGGDDVFAESKDNNNAGDSGSSSNDAGRMETEEVEDSEMPDLQEVPSVE